ncbi:MAG: hypothetical protein PHQ43_13680 [Dehalococcoidales bacterium]|nr:hypothetical protein [Dehalococcoidales bacterium]
MKKRLLTLCLSILIALLPLSAYAASGTGRAGQPVGATTTSKGVVQLATSAETATGTESGKAVVPSGMKAALQALEYSVNFAKPANIADSATPAIGAAAGNVLDLDGTTTITAFDTVQAGTTRFVRFTGARTITYNGTSMILPGARDIVTEANDRATFISLGSGNWYCHAYMKANGRVLGDAIIVTHGATEATTADKMRGQDHIITGAYTITLPACAVGMNATFTSTTAAAFSLDSNGADQFILAGTALTAGNKITSDGTAGVVVQVKCLQANKWHVTYTNSVMVDGGA